MTDTQQQPAAANPHSQTAYTILREAKHVGSEVVLVYAPVEANVVAANGNAAIRAVAKTEGVYVAIPARSFQPVKVKIEQTTVVKVG
jgi:hypothetical protein